MRIGLPRTLNLYYRYLPLIAAFFRRLGVELVVSPPSNKELVAWGVASTVEDACLPLKATFGHIHALEGVVDHIFLPRLVSLEPGSSLCPKFIGLPDMAKSCVSVDLPLISPVADVNKGAGGILETLSEAGRVLGFDPGDIDRALGTGERAQASYRAECIQGKDPAALLRAIEREGPYLPPQEGDELELRVIGRSYLIFDPFISLEILKRLRGMGCRILTHESVDHQTLDREMGSYKRPPYWTLSREILGAAGYFMRQEEVDGLVFVLPFQCGPASMLETLVEAVANEHPQTPYTAIVLDEHTGEAGLMTRLEAFLDMIRRRKARRAEG
jgi:predicted nucleotide-binding protein (sugar kinase/HSP70/actin superfamily)